MTRVERRSTAAARPAQRVALLAFNLGNGTLLLPACSTDLDYEEIVTRGDDTIGRLFALLLTDYHRSMGDQDLAHQLTTTA